MKKAILIALLLLISNNLFAAEKTFVIEGNIANIPDSTVIRLYDSDGFGDIELDIDTIISGKFRLEAKSDTIPKKYTLSMYILEDERVATLIWAYNNTTKITGNSKYADTWIKESDLKEQKDENIFINISKEDRKNLQMCLFQEQQIFGTYLQAMEDDDTNAMDVTAKQFKVARNKSDSLRKTLDLNHLKVLQNTKDISVVWLNYFSSVAYLVKDNPEYRDTILQLYNKLNEEQKKKQIYVTKILFPSDEVVDSENEENIKIGDTMIDATLDCIDGKKYTLSDIKGKYILLDFWSYGCGPCILANSELKEIVEKYGNTLQVVGINLDRESSWKKFYKPDEITWLNLRTDGTSTYSSGISKKYRLNGIPRYFLISPDHKIIDMQEGYAKGIITELLEKNGIKN